MMLLIDGTAALMVTAGATAMRHVIRIECQQAVTAFPHQGTDDCPRKADGFKPKTMRTRVGDMSLLILPVLKKHDDEDCRYSPERLERGYSSQQASTVVLSMVKAKGLSTRKLTAVVENLCSQEVRLSQFDGSTVENDRRSSTWKDSDGR